MKRSTLIIATVLAATPLVGRAADPPTKLEHGTVVVASLAGEKAFVATVSPAQMKQCPTWATDAAEPPFPALKALNRAEAKRRELVKDSDLWRWELDDAHLRAAVEDRWYYEVSFVAKRQGAAASTGHPPALTLLVLMDGTVPEPVVWERVAFFRAYEAGKFDVVRGPAGDLPRRRPLGEVSREEAGERVSEFFKDTSAVEDTLAKPGADPSLRAFAVWKQFTDGAAKSKTKDAVARLVGRLEAVVGAEAPQGWIDLLYRWGGPGKPMPDFDRTAYRSIGGGFRSMSYFSLAVDRDDILTVPTVQAGRRVTLYDLSHVDAVHTTAIEHLPVGATRHVLAVVGHNGFGFPILLVDAITRKEVWKTEVWSSGLTASGGPSGVSSGCWLRAHGDRATAFTADAYSFSIESFDLGTGKAVLRFNSSGWGMLTPKAAK
jgi:hypothetical protein